MNRDAQGAQWCRNQGYDGVDPNGWKYCYIDMLFRKYYKFKCATTHSIDWSPCYRDEDAYAMGYKNRDEAGLKWCQRQGFDSTDNWQYCGNWYYKFHCTTSIVLPEYVAIDLSSCDTSSDLATIEYLIKDGAYDDANTDCTTPLCKRDKDNITPVPDSWMQGFRNIIARWSLEMADYTQTGTRSEIFTYTDNSNRRWRIDRQAVFRDSSDNRLYHLYAVQSGSNTYASIRIPAGYLIGQRRIRNAFFQSQQYRQTGTLHVRDNMPPQIFSTIGTWAVRSLVWVAMFNRRTSGSLSILANSVAIPNEANSMPIPIENKTDDSNIFTIFLATDAYGSTETSWNLTRLYQNNKTEIANKYVGANGNNTTYSEQYVLDVGKYNFTIFDSGKNGICCDFGNGTYTIRLGQTILKTGGNFGAHDTTIFEVQHIQNITNTLVPAQNPIVAPTPKKPPMSVKKRSRAPKLSH